MGKTSFALNLAESAPLMKKSVGIFSLEMSKDQLIDRLLCLRPVLIHGSFERET